MSDVGLFGDLLGEVEGANAEGLGAYLNSTAGLGMVIRAGTEQGLSGRQILASYRDAGGTVADQRFWQLRNAVLGADQPPYGRDYASLLSGHDVMDTPGGREGLYQVNFRVFVQHDASSGLPEHSVTNFSMTQRELDIPDAAEAMSNLMDTLDNPSDAYGRWIGFEISGIVRYTG